MTREVNDEATKCETEEMSERNVTGPIVTQNSREDRNDMIAEIIILIHSSDSDSVQSSAVPA